MLSCSGQLFRACWYYIGTVYVASYYEAARALRSFRQIFLLYPTRHLPVSRAVKYPGIQEQKDKKF